jgi:hypothetical protein
MISKAHGRGSSQWAGDEGKQRMLLGNPDDTELNEM